MKKFNISVLVTLVCVFVLLTFASKSALEIFFNIPLFRFFYFLPSGFIIIGLVMLIILNNVNIKNANRLAQNILLIKSLKIFALLLVGVVYVVILDVNIRVFLVLMAVFYIVYLAFESVVLVKFEKLIKKLNE